MMKKREKNDRKVAISVDFLEIFCDFVCYHYNMINDAMYFVAA